MKTTNQHAQIGFDFIAMPPAAPPRLVRYWRHGWRLGAVIDRGGCFCSVLDIGDFDVRTFPAAELSSRTRPLDLSKKERRAMADRIWHRAQATGRIAAFAPAYKLIKKET